MALPLLLVGLSVASAIAIKEASSLPENIAEKEIGSLNIDDFQGAIVACGVFGCFEHSGVILDGQVVELKGNGLVRCVSLDRFLQNRSGNHVYVACNEKGQVMVNSQAAKRAKEAIFTYIDYQLLRNNCHSFVARCLFPHRSKPVIEFRELTSLLSRELHHPVEWQQIKINASLQGII